MTISDEIDGLRADRDNIRAAITAKGGTLPEGSPMSDYPAAISNLPTGGGGGEPVNVPYLSATGSTASPRAFLSIAKAVTSLDGFMLDTTGITNFSTMFRGCSSLTTVPTLDTAAGTTFTSMFSGCTALTSVPQLDTSKGMDFNTMFYGCTALTSVPQLDTSKGTTFTSMFSGCTALTQIGIYGFRYSIDISGCNLDAAALNAFFTQAGTAYNASQTITITGNPGATTCDKTIATNKGWTVTG